MKDEIFFDRDDSRYVFIQLAFALRNCLESRGLEFDTVRSGFLAYSLILQFLDDDTPEKTREDITQLLREIAEEAATGRFDLEREFTTVWH